MAEVYLSLGSNIGDRKKFIDSALELLKMDIDIKSYSSIYETAAWGETSQPSFLNMCISGSTSLSPEELLDFIHKTEAHVGRTPTFKWGPREIDIDILFYNQKIVSHPGLNIPHPHLHERAFVLVPLAEIAENYIHPELKKPISELLKRVDSNGVKLYK